MPQIHINMIDDRLVLTPIGSNRDEKRLANRVSKKRVTQEQALQQYNEGRALLFFTQVLANLPEPRRKQGIRYPLQTVVITALMAMICSADDAEGMEFWGQQNEHWLKEILDMPYGAPTQDVYLRVFAVLDPEHLGEVMRAWANMIALKLKGMGKKHIAIDGKTSRGSYDTAKEQPSIHTVSAWYREAGIVLGQVKTEQKSNEITAIPELLKKLDLKNAIITMDAMGCQANIAKQITAGGGDFVLSVKENQPSLYHDIKTAFQYGETCQTLKAHGKELPLPQPILETHFEVDKGHGRLEERTVEVCRDLDWLSEHKEKWPGISCFIKVTRKRTHLLSGKESVETAYYIASSSDGAEAMGLSIRGHWSIENNLHWVLDVAFREDDARHRAKNAADNMTRLRQFALSIIKQDKTRKLGVANSRKIAGWNPEYLIKLLMGHLSEN